MQKVCFDHIGSVKTTSLISTLYLFIISYYISVYQNNSTNIERSLISFLIEPKYDVKIEEEWSRNYFLDAYYDTLQGRKAREDFGKEFKESDSPIAKNNDANPKLIMAANYFQR